MAREKMETKQILISQNPQCEWILHWNPFSPALQQANTFWNTFEDKKDGKWYFFRDVGLGKKERVEIWSGGGEYFIQVRINTEQFCYAEWELVRMFRARAKEQPSWN